MDKLKNPKFILRFKRKSEFSRETIYQRLKPLGLDPFPIPLPKHDQDRTFSRPFISSIYGGSQKAERQIDGDSFFEKTGISNFLYINLWRYYHVPEVPGTPGLYMTVMDTGTELCADLSGVWVLFQAP
ncbi:hypothetical protein BDN72DRAFT_615585 [Pluteus cervinus]|uniref:Uncharacterized protein n=1 Tax=Pluteus cervinus TaxID=181527 RepID=A0ACD3A138_9AGAR|nr:hypothetical protein BDN72DRAFT_615585 [Pluteus cervinus]